MAAKLPVVRGMSPSFKPEAEFSIDAPLVRCLLEEQVPELAELPLVALGEGWDNRLFRLGDTFMVRLPRRTASAVLVAHEHRWLPELASRLPLPVPAPLHFGRAGCSFPWLWSITRWLEGESALTTAPQDPSETAVTLRDFLTALHQPAPLDAPFNPWRSVALEAGCRCCRRTSDRLPVLWMRGQSSVSCIARLARPPGQDPPCGSMVTCIPATFWSTPDGSRR